MDSLVSLNNTIGTINGWYTPFLSNILSSPLHYIGIGISFFAAIAFLTVIRGVFSILKHIIKIDGSSSHMEHSRTRAIWGMLLLFFYFALWEFLKWVASGFGGEAVSSIVLLTAGTLGILVLSLRLLYPPAKGGGH